MSDIWKNQLHFGDNLDVLRDHVQSDSVDLVYLDPPFNSNASYNVLFKEKTGKQSAAQITAFEDTWEWGDEPAKAYTEVVTAGPKKLADLVEAMYKFLGRNDMMAYLSMMAIRLVQLHRVLKPTGSIYLHCDPTASHYLKLLMDAIFTPESFRNEIVWKRTHAHGSSRRYGPVHDILFFYTKGNQYLWTNHMLSLDPAYVESHFTQVEPDTGRRFQPIVLTGPGVRNGESGQPWRNFDPTAFGRHWALPGEALRRFGIDAGTTQDRLDALDVAGRLYWPRNGGQPRLKHYLEETKGSPMQDVWSDVEPVNSQARERLGYATQKPHALLDRIILASSNEGDLVLDPFCGCGTAIVAAEKLHRRWIGIDVTYLAIDLIQRRLQDTFKSDLSPFDVHGIPRDLESAHALAVKDRYQFEWWAVMVVNAHPARDRKKGADRGIDGYISFLDDESGNVKKVVVQVKSGHVSVKDVRELQTVVAMEKAEIGALLTLEEPTKPMRDEAAASGFYEPEHFPGHRYPRLQIITVDEILKGHRILYPGMAPVTFKKAERQHKQPKTKQVQLL